MLVLLYKAQRLLPHALIENENAANPAFLIVCAIFVIANI